MSAFVVPTEHIHVLLKAGLSIPGIHGPVRWYTGNTRDLSMEELGRLRRELRHQNRDEVGRMLVSENIASVRHLYRSDAFGDPEQPVSYEYRDPFYKPTAVEALKAIDCYVYQSCEHPGWRQSEARRFCDGLRATLIHLLPGYDDAPWSWTDDDLRRKRADYWGPRERR